MKWLENLNNVMEAENHSKNRKKRHLFYLIIIAVGLITSFGSCSEEETNGNNGNKEEKWLKRANYLGSAVSNAVAFSINGKVYVGMGYANSFQSDLWEYDPATNKWTEKHYFPGDYLLSNKCFVADNKAYVIGYQYILWEYNPETDTWIEKSTCPIPSGVSVSFIFGISNKCYIGTTRYYWGTWGSYTLNEGLYEYDLATDTWKECAVFSGNTISDQAIASTEQNAYSIGGYSGGDHASSQANFYMYNPITDRWAERVTFPVKTKQGIAFCKDGIIYAGLGKDYYASQFAAQSIWRNEDHNKIYKYDSENNRWILETEAPIKGEGKSAVICNGKLYVGLGGSLDFWEYTF